MQSVDGVLAVVAGAGVAFLVVLTLLYLLPTIIAFVRGHHYRWIIFVINLFLGATGLGWVFTLVWALWPRQSSMMHPVLVNATEVAATQGVQPSDLAEEQSVGPLRHYDEQPQVSLPRYLLSGLAPPMIAVTLVISALVGTYYFIPESVWAHSSKPRVSFEVTRTTNARSGPSTSAAVVGTVAVGDVLEGRVELGPNQVARWLHVEEGEFAGGYVSLSNLKSTED